MVFSLSDSLVVYTLKLRQQEQSDRSNFVYFFYIFLVISLQIGNNTELAKKNIFLTSRPLLLILVPQLNIFFCHQPNVKCQLVLRLVLYFIKFVGRDKFSAVSLLMLLYLCYVI